MRETDGRTFNIQRHSSTATASEIFDSVVRPLFVETHRDVAGDRFYAAERFIERLRSHARAPGFELVVASQDSRAVGQAYGYTLQRDTRWWKFLTTPVADEIIEENGARTFALAELMVHPDWQRHGVARVLHDSILGGRSEPRATLLVRENNTAAQKAYTKWGWQQLGKV